MRTTLFTWAAVIALALVAPSAASADSGSITNVFTQADGTIMATYTSVSTCAGDPDSPNDCSWWPHAVQGPADVGCYPYVSGDGRLTYVGGNGDDIWIGPNTETTSDYFYPDWNPVRICLYINYGGDNRILIAQTIFDASAGSSTPIPTPPTEAVVPPMSVREARAEVPRVLRKEYGRRFRRVTLRRSCFRLTSEKVRCRVSWRKRNYRYRGNVTLWNDPQDPANSYIYTSTIKRKRIRSASPPPARRVCDPNYSGCLDPNASDYDCAGGSGDGPRYTGPVRVYGNDHFDLDRDGDGIGCDEASASAAAVSDVVEYKAERAAVRGGRGRR